MNILVKSVVLFLGLLLQTTFISTFRIFGVVSNLFLVLLLYITSVSDTKQSIWLGTVFGIFVDFTCAKIFGINTALCLLFAIAISFISNRMRNKNLIYYFIITFLFTGLYEYISAALLMGSSMNVTLWQLFLNKVLPVAIGNMLWMILVYILFEKFLKKIHLKERTE